MRRGRLEAQVPLCMCLGLFTGPQVAGRLGLGRAAASCFSQELLGSTSQDPSLVELNQEL